VVRLPGNEQEVRPIGFREADPRRGRPRQKGSLALAINSNAFDIPCSKSDVRNPTSNVIE